MKLKILIALAIAVAGNSAQAGLLYDNGAVVDSGGLSIIRAGGNTFGFGAQQATPNRVADNFAVAGPSWNVESLSFFAYQTGAQSAFTFTSVAWSVILGDVNTGTLVASNTTNVTNGGLLGYRVTSTMQTDTSRAIFELIADVPDFSLAAGSYWLRWSIAGTLASGPWQPPTANGAVGNAQQSLANGLFIPALDSASGVELPFVIRGSSSVPVPVPGSLALLGIGLACLGLSGRRKAA